MVMNLIQKTVKKINRLGDFIILFFELLKNTVCFRMKLKHVLQQIKFLGNNSMAIIIVSGLFVGLVLGLQGYYTLRRYGSEEALGLLVCLSLVRELGPVVASLLFSGRAGTSLTAEIGLMRAGEQFSALEAMGVNPVVRILTPRFVGGVISVPILCALFSAVGVLGGWLIAVLMIGVDPGAFWGQMSSGVDFREDVLNGIMKSCIFGIAITQIALYMGNSAKPTPEGVSSATTSCVVISAFAILGLDFILTAFMFNN